MAESKWPWVQEHMGLIADWVRNGATDKDVMERIGICNATFYQYKKMYPEFAETLKRTKEVVDAEVVNALLEKAKSGDTTAMIFWLKNRLPAQWRDRREVGIDGELKTYSIGLPSEVLGDEPTSE